MPEIIEANANILVNLALSMQENKCESFVITPYGLSLINQPSIDQYEFNFTLNLNLIQQSQHARVNAQVKLIEKKADNGRMEIAELKSTHLFWIQNFNEVIFTNSSGEMVIPNQLLEICNSISISSIRGMFSIKTEGTYFQNAVLPLIDPKMLIPHVPIAG